MTKWKVGDVAALRVEIDKTLPYMNGEGYRFRGAKGGVGPIEAAELLAPWHTAAEWDALRAKLAAAEAVMQYARHRPGCMVGKPWRCECGYTDTAAAYVLLAESSALTPTEKPHE